MVKIKSGSDGERESTGDNKNEDKMGATTEK